jgi:adenine phosphoribosyltransferase
MERLKSYIRDIPDFPKPGILFKDITPLVKNPATLKLAVHQIVDPFLDQRISAVAGMEARGFIFGALAAWELGVGFIPLRKPGKLPYNVHSVSYDLEYGSTALEAHIDALEPGDRVLLVDDLLATGGTAKASCELIEQLGAEVAACAFVVELDDLRGRQKIGEYRIHSLLHYSDLF